METQIGTGGAAQDGDSIRRGCFNPQTKRAREQVCVFRAVTFPRKSGSKHRLILTLAVTLGVKSGVLACVAAKPTPCFLNADEAILEVRTAIGRPHSILRAKLEPLS